MQKIANLSNILNEFFNKTADDISLTTGFIKRKRKLKGSSFIKALILGNLGNGNCSIDGFCQFLYLITNESQLALRAFLASAMFVKLQTPIV